MRLRIDRDLGAGLFGGLVVLSLVLVSSAALASEEVEIAADDLAEPLAVHVQVLRYQTVDDAVEMVYRLLSEDGTVELRPGGSTLVIRDTSLALERIVPVRRRPPMYREAPSEKT